MLQERLHRLGHRRFERVRADRQRDAGHRRDQRRPAGRAVHDHRCRDAATRRRDADDLAVDDVDVEQLRLLVDLHAHRVGGAGVAPVDGVVADRATGWVVQGAEDRIPRVLADVHERDEPGDLLRADHLGVDALQLVDLRPPAHRPQGRVVVGEREMSPLREHHVEVQLCGQLLVELDGAVVEGDAVGRQVVRPHDGGVPPGPAAADVALVDDRHVRDAPVRWPGSRRWPARGRRRRR